jgi:two-component system nitrogen regulation sensor histidine kinase GlnL
MLQQDVIDNISSGVIGLDEQFRVRLINPAAEAQLQLSEARVLGHTLFDIETPELPWRSSLEQAASEDRTIVRRSVTLDQRDGPAALADMFVSPLRDVKGLAYLIELQPVDRLLRISREENQLSAQETTRSVVRGLAHEIKNPLGGIRGAAQLLERELPEGPLREYTGIVIREADRLRALVDRLLGPNRRLEMVSLNVHAVTEHVRQLIEAEEGRGLVITRDYDPSLPEIRGDREELIQAVLNILRNAVEASAGRPGCAIVLRTRSQRQFTIGETRHRLVCRIDIIDDGPGVPDDYRDTLFAPMVSGRPEGTGLGLSIAQSIVSRHGGMITCDSEPGQTCFSMYLPMET